jgi:hypothetical protein
MLRLVRIGTRNRLKQDGKWDRYITSVTQTLAKTFPYPQNKDRNLWTRFLLYAQTALDFLEGTGYKDTASNLISNLGSSFDCPGKYHELQIIHQRTHELTDNILGKKHPSTLASMNNLREVLQCLGKYNEAE